MVTTFGQVKPLLVHSNSPVKPHSCTHQSVYWCRNTVHADSCNPDIFQRLQVVLNVWILAVANEPPFASGG